MWRGLLAVLLALCWSCPGGCVRNDRPIIGVLAQEPSVAISRIYPGHDSYIAASYVKAVQASGARVVPVLTNRDRHYYRRMVSSVNGLLLPGGSTWFYDHPGGYADAGQILFEEAQAANKNGTHFPVLGICLGFELLLFLDLGRKEYRAACRMKNIAIPLDLRDVRSSKLFADAPQEVMHILSTQNVTYNQHQFCVTETNMTALGLSERWRVLSTNEDPAYELTFVSSVESVEYPFVGLQFHPEKNGYEWRADLQIPHSADAIRSARFFFDWLVADARKNGNRFEDEEEEEDSLIANFRPEFTRNRLVYDEVYLFKEDRSGTSSLIASLLVLAISLGSTLFL